MPNMLSSWEVTKRPKTKSGKCLISSPALALDWPPHVPGDLPFCRLCDPSHLPSLAGSLCGVGGESVSGTEGLTGRDLIEASLFEKADRPLLGEENRPGYFLIWCTLENR